MLSRILVAALSFLLLPAPLAARPDDAARAPRPDFLAPAPAAEESGPSFSAFPILMYDGDIGFGYGGKAKVVGLFRRGESLDLVLFNSTKGESWGLFTFAIPDFEIRQGKVYGLSFDLSAEYDRYRSYGFYGTGEHSSESDLSPAATEKSNLQATFGRGFAPWFVVEVSAAVRRMRTYDVEPGTRFAERLRAEGDRTYPIFSTAVRFDTSNSQIHPTRGVRALLQGDFAAGKAGPDGARFFRFTGDLRSYVRVFGERDVFAARLLAQGVSGREIPLWELSTLGGGSTQSALRGFALNRFMDRVKLLACVEYRFPIWERIGGNLFIEAGGTGRGWREIFPPGVIHADAGWGLRYYLRNFVVRFDMGFSREGTGIYFNFGHLF